MSNVKLILVPLALAGLAACESEAEDRADATEDRIEARAESSAAQAGAEPAALGLSEAQLLEADLVTAEGIELGSVEQVRRGTGGAVDGLLVEIEDSSPDRYVVVPLDGLTTRADGDDTNLQATMSAEDLAALPDAPLGAQ